MAQMYFGAKEDTYDHRDFKKVYNRSEIPHHPAVDLRKYVDHVYNQGRLGSCTANALCAAYGLDLKKQEATLPGGFSYFDPSRLFLYYNTREYEGTTQSDSGASIRDTVKALNRRGVCKEYDWPYEIRNYKIKPPRRCYTAAEGNNLCKYERLQQNIDQFRACLNDKCPIAFGFKVFKSFSRIGYDGVMTMPSDLDEYYGEQGHHAVIAVGYDDRKRKIIALNSWGEGWGNGGYFYMPYDYIKDSEYCSDFWKITFACERGRPRPQGTVSASSYGVSSSSSGYTASGLSWYGNSGYSSGGGQGACGCSSGSSGYYSGYRRY